MMIVEITIIIAIIILYILMFKLYRLLKEQQNYIKDIDKEITKVANQINAFINTYGNNQYKNVNRLKDIVVKAETNAKKLNRINDKTESIAKILIVPDKKLKNK